jgi:hypothetical protein
MKTYKTVKIGQFKRTSDEGIPSKTYVYYVKETNAIAIKRLGYTTEMPGWMIIKDFKGKHLFMEQMHIKLESFETINQLVTSFLMWNTKNFMQL